MPRTALPYTAPDLSALARTLERELAQHQAMHGRLPGHVEMMNLLARGAGKRNLQHWQTEHASADRVPPTKGDPGSDPWFDAPPILDLMATARPAMPLSRHAAKALQSFDSAGRLARWPLKLSVQRLALWVLWTRFEIRRSYTEAEVNQILRTWHTYGDHATLRRELVNHRLMTRRSDCTDYRKVSLSPDPETQALIRALRSPNRLIEGAPAIALRGALAG